MMYRQKYHKAVYKIWRHTFDKIQYGVSAEMIVP